jgi:peptide/nickel transport system permease protein
MAIDAGRAVTFRIRRLPTRSKVALAFVVFVALIGIVANVITRDNPLITYTPVRPPSGTHWLGTDILGRDIFSRLVLGTRDSLVIGFGSTALALTVAILLGSIAATSSKVIDELVMRGCDVIMTFPGIALAAVLVTAFGSGLIVLVCTIAFLYLPILTRVVRANVMAQYSEDYVRAETVIGAHKWFILRRHVAVNCAAPVLVVCTLMVANAIVFEASLSFIGAGVQPPTPSWGNVLSSGRNLIIAGGWWATLFPGILILLTVLALNILAESISDSWGAPSTRSTTRRSREPAEGANPIGFSESLVQQPTSSVSLADAAKRLRARARPIPSGAPALAVKDLTVRFAGLHAGKAVVDAVSFEVRAGEVLGLVGESGCGKSLLSLAIMGLTPRTCEVTGKVFFGGVDLLQLRGEHRRRLLGHEMAMVYQDALSSLNPSMTIKAQLRQLVRRGGSQSSADLLALVGLDPERTLRSYPHELSGGQRQRVLIAMALSRSPKLLVADEPTTALDVTVQAQVLELLLRLREELGFALIIVSHDLALIADVTDRVIVMYGGQIVESGLTPDVVESPAHHYSSGLLTSVLSLEASDSLLSEIPGVVPSPADFGPGCRFADRCTSASAVCFAERPVTGLMSGTHYFACHNPIDGVCSSDSSRAGAAK